MIGLASLLRWLGAVNHGITSFGLWIAATLMGLIAVLVATQVFFRYVLNNSLLWAEDLSLMMLVASTFLIMPYAYRWSLHVGIDLFMDLLPARPRFLLLLLSGTVILVLTFYLIGVSWQISARSTIWANAVPIKMKYVYAILPISFALLVPSIIELQIRAFVGLVKPLDENAKLPRTPDVD